ncbi:MAG: histidine kinase N-terminal 7TM domain-containing protein [bacterium]|nr:PAS domain-containing protein [Candidatus Margulisiibacteriota bacterium]
MSILFPYFELTASLFVLLFSFIIFSRHYENKAARFFSRFALLAFLSCIFTYSFRIAFTLELAQTINRISVTLVSFSFALFVHFALIFAKKNAFLKEKIALYIIYLPPTAVSSFFLFTNLMYKRYEILSYGIVSIPTIWYSIFIAYSVAYGFWGITLFFSYAKKAHQKIEKHQAFFIAAGAAIPFLIGLITDELLPLIFQTRLTPPTIVFDFALMTFFLFLAMRHYSLFAISPALAADSIIETMPDSLIVTDLRGRVIIVNEEAHKYFHVPKEEIKGHYIAKLFENKGEYEKLYEEVVNKSLEIERYKATLCDPCGECLPSFINANALRDSLGALIGIIFVIRDSRA